MTMGFVVLMEDDGVGDEGGDPGCFAGFGEDAEGRWRGGGGRVRVVLVFWGAGVAYFGEGGADVGRVEVGLFGVGEGFEGGCFGDGWGGESEEEEEGCEEGWLGVHYTESVG